MNSINITKDKFTKAKIIKNNQLASTSDFSTSFKDNANNERNVTANIDIIGVFVTSSTYLKIDNWG